MSDEKRSGEELLDEPQFSNLDGSINTDTPFNQSLDALMVTSDKELELMCRATPQIAEAASIAYNLNYRFHCSYIQNRIEQIERLSVSIGGKGRGEIVQSLQAGSNIPGEFYEQGSSSIRGFSED